MRLLACLAALRGFDALSDQLSHTTPACLKLEEGVLQGDWPDGFTERADVAVTVRALTTFCNSANAAHRAMDVYHSWDVRTVVALASARRAFDSLREEEVCTSLAGVQYCGVLVDIFVLFERWLHDDWGASRWFLMASKVSPPARLEATRLYARWVVLRAWHDVACRHATREDFKPFCLGTHLNVAITAAKAAHEPGLAQEIYDEIMALGPSPGPVRWQSLWRTHEFHIPESRDENALRPANPDRMFDPHIHRVADTAEIGALEVLSEWRESRSMSWLYDDEYLSFPENVDNGSAAAFQWTVYSAATGWDAKLCKSMPVLCGEFGTKILMAGKSERSGEDYGDDEGSEVLEVSLNQLPPGAHLGVHSGSPLRINMQMGLTGISPASFLAVRKPNAEPVYLNWTPGRVTVVFDDSYDHYVQVDPEVPEPRVVLHVALCHPSVRPCIEGA